MCYSAQVIQMVRKLSRQLGLRLDYDEVERLFFRRLDDPSLNISRGFQANFDEPTTDQERRIRGESRHSGFPARSAKGRLTASQTTDQYIDGMMRKSVRFTRWRRRRSPYKALGRQEPVLDILPRFGAIRSHRGASIICPAVSRMHGNRRRHVAAI